MQLKCHSIPSINLYFFAINIFSQRFPKRKINDRKEQKKKKKKKKTFPVFLCIFGKMKRKIVCIRKFNFQIINHLENENLILFETEVCCSSILDIVT